MDAPPREIPDAEEASSPLAKTVRTGIKIAAWPLSAAAAWWSATSVIRNEIYKNIARTGIFDSSRKQLKNDPLKKLIEDSAEKPNPAVPELMKEINENYRQNVKHMMEQAGFYGVKDYWKGLNRNQRAQAGVFGATVGGILLGAMLEIANNKGLLERMTRAENKLRKEDPEITS